MCSYVYFISDGQKVKIGKSDNPYKRIKELQTASSSKLEIIKLLECEDTESAFALEKKLHCEYLEYRGIGEWFNLTAVMNRFTITFDFIDELYNMTKSERTAVRIIKNAIKWNSELQYLDFVATVTKLNPEFTSGKHTYTSFLKGYSTLHKRDLIRRVSTGKYMLNPDLLIPSNEQLLFQLKWDESPKHKPNL